MRTVECRIEFYVKPKYNVHRQRVYAKKCEGEEKALEFFVKFLSLCLLGKYMSFLFLEAIFLTSFSVHAAAAFFFRLSGFSF